ncbi:MAG: hypothetical protein IJU80_01055 [Lachnospiraceae bacterium]|nr:hypothetical protein [Lachnospiraceae bacterium]
MKPSELDQLLIEIFQVNPKNTERHVFKVCNLKILKLRDVLVQIGHICQENLEKQEYVATMGAGFRKANIAYLAMRLEEDKLYISINAKEGFVNQHTCKGAIHELKKKLGEYVEGEE